MSSPAISTSISHIGQIAINIQDTDRAVDFYQNKLGLPMLFRAGDLAFFQSGQTRLMLSKPSKPEFDHPSSILYFFVPDLPSAHAQIKTRGVEFIDEPHLVAKLPDHDLWMCFFKDSEGNTFALMSEVRPPAK
ncbi:MAG TPA: VOC family protein [Terriglobales bacterium]|nr:VOC family protein [Terriglobales bacterium]